jgi:hypothetical protein
MLMTVAEAEKEELKFEPLARPHIPWCSIGVEGE